MRSRVLFGERHLWYVVKEFMARYHADRFHQGPRGQLIESDDEPSDFAGSRVR
jgi:hypothetical protein